MTAAERAFWLRAQRHAAAMSADVGRAYLRGLAALRERMPLGEVEQLIRNGNVESVVRLVAGDAEFARAFAQYVREIRAGIERATNAGARTISGGRFGGPPRTTRRPRTGFPSPPVGRSIEVGFDILNPKVIDAVRGMETRSLGTIQDEIRDTVRAHIENGIRDGVGPRTTARELREVIGLAPNQEEAVRNFRRALQEGDYSKALGYQLRDRRSDGVLSRLRGDGGKLTAGQIESMAARYRKNFVAWNAETHARTAALEAQRIGKRLSWQQAIDGGVFDGRRTLKRWIHLAGQKDPRPEHEALDGVEVAFDDPYPNGDMYPGEHDPWNCFAAGTSVEGAFLVGLKTHYSGPMREIETARGYRLTVTPNHPILTLKGWVAARDLDKGENVLSKTADVNAIAISVVDDQQRPSRIEDVFQALASNGVSKLPLSVKLDLHGDAIHAVGDVEVVGADGVFSDERRVADQKCLDQRPFGAVASAPSVSVDGERRLAPLFDAARSSASSSPCAPEQLRGSSGIAADISPPVALSVGAAAQYDVRIPEILGDSGTAVAAFLLQLQQACPGLVSPDEIVGIRDFEAARVHVYDLQSTTGWLLAGNVIASNCHCVELYRVELRRSG